MTGRVGRSQDPGYVRSRWQLGARRPGRGTSERAARFAGPSRPRQTLEGLQPRHVALRGVRSKAGLRGHAVRGVASGRRVVFGSPGAPAARWSIAVPGRASVPVAVRADRNRRSQYVDGGSGAGRKTWKSRAPSAGLGSVLCMKTRGEPTGNRLVCRCSAGRIAVVIEGGLRRSPLRPPAGVMSARAGGSAEECRREWGPNMMGTGGAGPGACFAAG